MRLNQGAEAAHFDHSIAIGHTIGGEIEKAENLLFVIFRQFGAFGAATNRKDRVWMEVAVLDTSGPKRFDHLPGGAPHHTNEKRTEERRVGKECGSTCRSRGA